MIVNLVIYIGLLVVFFVVLRAIFMKGTTIDTSSGAALMAIGIFINGALKTFDHMNDMLGTLITISLFALWIIFMWFLFLSILRKTFMEEHVNNPVKSFAMGTWIAGTSVCGTAIYLRLPELGPIVMFMSFINVCFWFYYIVICIKNFMKLYQEKRYKLTHGVILLSTVSTQSLVVINYTLFRGMFPSYIYAFFIYLGTVFYFVGFVLIVKRYSKWKEWKIADDWQNTNCILHGAMSITGLASAVSGAVPDGFTLFVWIWVLVWFVIVECIELWRVLSRIHHYRFNLGFGTYDVSQWARNFTFGMLYAFTANFDIVSTSFGGNLFLVHLRSLILGYGHWVVLAILINEILLFLKAKVNWKQLFKSSEFKKQPNII